MTDDQSMIIVHAAPYACQERKKRAQEGAKQKKVLRGEIKKNALRRKGTLSA
jgi:hypothetical protein